MPKVLIIEDRRENIVFIANNILKPLGYDVITAMDGQTGLTKAQEEAPDLIITDLKLPRLSGLDILAQLAKAGLHIPAIVMTFHGSEETAVQAFRLGARDYLVKPFSIEDMHEALKRALAPLLNQTSKANHDAEARVVQLEQELGQTRAILAKRENQLVQMHRQLTESLKRAQPTNLAQRAAEWEEDNARLNKVLAQNKEMLSKAENQARALEEAMLEQKGQLSKYQQETRRLAEQLRNLTEAVRLLSQDLEQQTRRLEILTPRDETG